MSRIVTPSTIEASPAASQDLLKVVQKQLGGVPNMFRLIGVSPASLEGYLGLSGALARGQLDPRTRNRIALAVAEANDCDYCRAAHTALGKGQKLEDREMRANRDGGSGDPKAAAAVRFARTLTLSRGVVSEAELKAVREAGWGDSALLEIVLHVALNTLTNYVNKAFATDLDFSPVER